MEETSEIMKKETEPQEVVDNARKAANVLKGLLDAKEKKVIINGKRYLEFDDWQTIASFFRSTVKTEEAIPIEVNGVKGAKAKAQVLRDGIVIGGAEAYCMMDEKQWKTKPFHQVASMAQTRAASKALSNVFRWVVILGSVAEGTPAEEMENEENGKTANLQQKGGVICSNCDKELTPKVLDYSLSKFGRPLCFDCQDLAKQGKLEKKKQQTMDAEFSVPELKHEDVEI